MLNTIELQALFEVLGDSSKTFEACLQQFLKVYNKAQQFMACCTLCYLLENNVSPSALL